MAALEVWLTYVSEQQLTTITKQAEILALQKTILAALGTQTDPTLPPFLNPDGINELIGHFREQELKIVGDQLKAIRFRLFGEPPEGKN